MKKKKIKIRLPDHLKAAEQQHAELLDKLARLETDTHKSRAKYELLAACLELLRWLHEKQEQEDASSQAVPVDELLELEQLLLQLAPQPSETSAGPPSDAATPDAWRTCPIAPNQDPLALLREVFQRLPHPGVGPDTTLQQLQDEYAAFCSELALHMRVQANSHMSAEAAAASAARARAAMVGWFSLVVTVISSPHAALMARLLSINCMTGETVACDVHSKLQHAALQGIVLSLEQQERITLAFEVLSQLHTSSLQEAMVLRCSLGEPAADLFGAAALPVGLLQPAAGAGHAVLRERHQSDLQRLRVKLNKAFFWEHCLCCSFAGALTVNQVCELALAMFPCQLRLPMMARRVAAMHQEIQQEQQAAVARDQQQGTRRRRQTLHQQSGSGDNTARSGTGIAAGGSGG